MCVCERVWLRLFFPSPVLCLSIFFYFFLHVWIKFFFSFTFPVETRDGRPVTSSLTACRICTDFSRQGKSTHSPVVTPIMIILLIIGITNLKRLPPPVKHTNTTIYIYITKRSRSTLISRWEKFEQQVETFSSLSFFFLRKPL